MLNSEGIQEGKQKKYEKHFKKSIINIKDIINNWPEHINVDEITEFYTLKKADMIFIPLFIKDGKFILSRDDYYCTICGKWNKIANSVKNIKRHASIHLPEVFEKYVGKKNIAVMNDNQEKNFIRNIICFVLFDADAFVAIESQFLKNLTGTLPSRKKLMLVLKNISKQTQKDIASILSFSTINSRDSSYLENPLRIAHSQFDF